jgi:uncharacterized protein YkwD
LRLLSWQTVKPDAPDIAPGSRPMAFAVGSAVAQPSQALVNLINVYRGEKRPCEGRRSGAVGPLAANGGLSDAQTSADTDMQAALKQQGYQPACVLTINLTGPTSASAAMRLNLARAESRICGERSFAAAQPLAAWLSSPPHCANLMNPNDTAMGAACAVNANSDRTIYWTQVFATPR